MQEKRKQIAPGFSCLLSLSITESSFQMTLIIIGELFTVFNVYVAVNFFTSGNLCFSFVFGYGNVSK